VANGEGEGAGIFIPGICSCAPVGINTQSKAANARDNLTLIPEVSSKDLEKTRQAGAELQSAPAGQIKVRGTQLVLVAFLLGMGHESPLQQHDAALSLPLQQAWAFLPLRFFLQHDMAPSLQQLAISQQAEVLWLLF